MTATLERPTTDAPAQTKRGKKAAATAALSTGLALSISQTALAGALTKVTRAVGSRNLPILNNVKLTATTDADGGTLELACTDLSIAIVVRTVADVTGEGAYTVPAKLLAEFVGTLPPGQPVALRLDGTALRVECGRAKAQIKGSPIDDFPPLPAPKDGQAPLAMLDAEALNKALALVSIAPLQDPLLGLRNAVHLQSGDGLRIESTDGNRLAIALDPEGAGSLWEPFNVIVPLRGTQEIGRLAVDGELAVWLLPSAEQPNILVAKSENASVAVRLLEGTYYDLERVAPKDFILTLTASRTALLAVTKQAMLFAASEAGKDGKGDFRTLICLPAGAGDTGTLAITSRDAEVGTGDFELSVSVDGEPFAFAVNGYYLRDVLGALDSDTVELKLSGKLSPILIADPALPTFRYVVMPIHVASLADAPKVEAPADESEASE